MKYFRINNIIILILVVSLTLLGSSLLNLVLIVYYATIVIPVNVALWGLMVILLLYAILVSAMIADSMKFKR